MLQPTSIEKRPPYLQCFGGKKGLMSSFYLRKMFSPTSWILQKQLFLSPSQPLNQQHIRPLASWAINSQPIRARGIIVKDLNFNEHEADIVRKLSNQIQVMQRHKKFINTDTKTKLYKAYLLPHLYYFCFVWHHCGQRNGEGTWRKLMNVAYDLFSMIMIVIIII